MGDGSRIEDAPAIKTREVLGWADEPVKRYLKDLEGAGSAEELRDAVARWPKLAGDAIEQAHADGFDWGDFEAGLARERKGHFAGEEWARRYGAILMPGAMLRVSMIVAQFHVPFGTAYIRAYLSGRDDLLTWKQDAGATPEPR